MAYDERLVERVRHVLKKRRGVAEKKMFGGVCFMVSGSMACGVNGDDLVVRVGPDDYDRAMKRKHVRAMDFTGKPLKGFVYVGAQGTRTKKALEGWVDRGRVYASSVKKK